MPAIAKHNDVLTVIIIFAVEPARQQELIDAIVDFLEIVKQQPGFVSSSIHKSIDGVRVMNYAQWQSQEAYQAFVNNTQVQAQGKKLTQYQIHEYHL